MRWSVRLRACLAEGKTPHGAPVGRQRRQRPDAYQRHAVVAIVAGRRKNRPAHRKDADVAHDIARGVATTKWGPKLPYYRRGTHTQTPRGKVNIRRHQREASRAAKDAQYDRLVGKRAAQFERPWTVKGEAWSVRLQALVEAYAVDPAVLARQDAQRDATPRWRVTVGGLSASEVRWLRAAVTWPDDALVGPWERLDGDTGQVVILGVVAETRDSAWVEIRARLEKAYRDASRRRPTTIQYGARRS
jgi:hypothetical protein